MKKILILQEIITKYRIPVFSKLAEKYDVTIVTTADKEVIQGELFRHLIIREWKLGPFKWVPGVWKLCHENDIVVYMPDLHILNYCLVPLIPHRYKTISFSIGFRASYSKHYNLNRKKVFGDRVFEFFLFRADAVLVYFREVLNFWNVSRKIMSKCFETRNTVEVKPLPSIKSNKNTILFIGTLYKEKKVDVLINAYYQAISSCDMDDFPCLEIIGEGAMMEELKQQVKQYGIESKVYFTGPIYDENEISIHFSHALISVSPNQAGLSVPHSLGYGVPFVTTKDAITGGEILHIKNGVNGLLMDSLDDLPSVIMDVFRNKEKYIQMGENAINYYWHSASIDIMIKGFDDAIKYALH